MDEIKYKVALEFIIEQLLENNDFVDISMINKACEVIKQKINNSELEVLEEKISHIILSNKDILGYQKEGSSFIIYNKTFTKKFRYVFGPLNGSYQNEKGDLIKNIFKKIDFSHIKPERKYIFKKTEYKILEKRLSDMNPLELKYYYQLLTQLPGNIRIEGIDNKELCGAIKYQIEK